MTTETQAPDPARIAVPYGMALVPLQATFEMVSAFHEVTDDDQLAYGNAQSRWRAMLASAPVVAPLTLETAEEARADRAHAESYFRQAEKLLTANEQTLRAERDQLLEQLAAAQREVVELRAAIPAPEGAQALTDDQIRRAYGDATGFDLDSSPVALLDFARAIERAALAAPAPQAAPASHAEFALRALVAAGHITQDTADEAMRIAERAHGIPAPQTKEPKA